MNNIKNIVIFKSIENGKETVRSCIFYNDGSVKLGDYADGIAAIKEVAKEKNIKSKDALKEMMNKDIFYVMTEKQFKEKYNSFLPEKEEEIEEIEETEVVLTEPGIVYDVNDMEESEEKKVEETTDSEEDKLEEDEEVVYEEDYKEDNYYNDFTQDEEDKLEEDEEVEEETTTKKNGLGKKIIAGLVVVGTILLGSYAVSRCSKKGILKEEPTTTTTDTTTTINNDENQITDQSTYVVRNNDLYNDYTFAELLDVTTNNFQKDSMIKASSALTGFNGVFAKNYLESGHDIKAALTFDEVVALQQAYNNYSTDEVRAYFNGYEVDAVYMSNAYKSASLQLMGAYTIESSKNPVDMSILIDSQEGRDFYNRYHAMFLAAKEAKGDEQLRLVKEFYAAVEKDFPITEEVRTEGISHSEDHNSLKDYQLAVTPMIASAEMIFQNLNVDYTLDDTKIDFINDIGLCNHADDKFERLETITLSAYEDKENPKYVQYKNAIIKDLVKDGEYVIDDAHRELSNLRRFQEIVNGDPNWKHRTTYEGEYGESYTSYEEEIETITWEESSTEYETVVTTEVLPIPDEEQKKIDDQINKENEDAKKKAEEEAEQEAARQQEEENKKADEITKEVEEDNKKVQEDINDINKTIDDNNKDNDKSNDKPVNENNYDNIDFDDQHSDEQGNLNDSVHNVTEDGTGADEPLPDPNVTGAEFDSKSADLGYTTAYVADDSGSTTYVEWAEDGAYIEYEEGYIPFDEDGNPIVVEETGYQYTR